MKSIIFLFAIISLTILLNSCEPAVQSLHPIYTTDLLIEEPTVEGIWYYNNNTKDTVYWEVKACDNKKYLIKVHDNSDKNKEAFFYLHLIKLKNNIYADLFPLEESYLIADSDPGIFLMSHLTPVHSFSKLSIDKNNVDVQYFASKWLKTILKKHKNCIDYQKINISDCEGENCYLLTSPPNKLQKLILKYGKENSKLQNNKIKFKRLNTINK